MCSDAPRVDKCLSVSSLPAAAQSHKEIFVSFMTFFSVSAHTHKHTHTLHRKYSILLRALQIMMFDLGKQGSSLECVCVCPEVDKHLPPSASSLTLSLAQNRLCPASIPVSLSLLFFLFQLHSLSLSLLLYLPLPQSLPVHTPSLPISLPWLTPPLQD